MPKHVQFPQQRVHIATQVSTDTVLIPSTIAGTLPTDPALINVLVSQGYVLHDVANGDSDLSWTLGTANGNGDVPITFSRNLTTEWVKISWLG